MVLSKKLHLCARVGLDFFEFLGDTERTGVTDKSQLREIYNTEFRARIHGVKAPNFGSVLYSLKVSYRVTVKRDVVTFTRSVRAHDQDQWRTVRCRRPDSGPSVDPVQSELQSQRSLAKLLMKKLKTNRSTFISDKRGVRIRSDHRFEDGRLQLTVTEAQQYVVKMFVENCGTAPVHFTYYTPLHFLRYFSLVDEHKVTRTKPLTLQSGDSYEVQLHFHCTLVGFYPATLAFEFKSHSESTAAFHIVRFVEAHCMSSLGLELAPEAPYRQQAAIVLHSQGKSRIVDGRRPEGMTVMQLKNEVPLKYYNLPKGVQQLVVALKRGSSTDETTLLESPLSFGNYRDKFRLLLQLEEHQMLSDMRRYNIPNSERGPADMSLDPCDGKLLILQVPGVSENRPSVLRGDQLLVYPTDDPSAKYRGYVHSVQQDSVRLGFSSELLSRFIEGMKFNVEFAVNRVPLRAQHRAAEIVTEHMLEPVLFPAVPTHNPDVPPGSLRLFDSQLERNQQQYQAVCHIVAGSSKPAPYLVFGPPGTGKTVTLVEAIKQIEKTEAGCHILACAPSNSAADLLCRRILDHVDLHKVYRMYASSRDPVCVPGDLKSCSNLVGDCYLFPPKEELMKFRILVTTLISAARLVSGNIPTGHFTHVFVDEAGHAVETECIIPLAGLLQAGSGQVVLAGDPKQLGPILRSPFAVKYGLGVSFLERIMTDFPQYQKKDGVFSNRFVTKLLKNYRSHPAILKVPNELFYDGELEVCADEIIRNSYCQWQHLPKKGFPVIFHAVTGIDERESNSPSFFNRAEAEVVVDYVKKLLETQRKKGLASISPRDIGIIAPYRKQVQKIRKALQKIQKDLKLKDMNQLKVGSVEEFQGQERRVILVSTVRSSPDYAEIDKKFHLGFVKNEKRFNVAVTRAKALLVVVGNPRVLKMDPVWSRFLQYCGDEGGLCGYVHSEEDADVIARLASLSLHMQVEVETEESVVQQQLDPEWRSDL
ncbi:putative helicase mov-10-B.1 isoform 1-T1 [Synchiropus picturatus]